MLVLSRRRDESIMIGDDIEIIIVDVRGDKVRLGITAPKDIPVHRKEIYEAIKREKARKKEEQQKKAKEEKEEEKKEVANQAEKPPDKQPQAQTEEKKQPSEKQPEQEAHKRQ